MYIMYLIYSHLQTADQAKSCQNLLVSKCRSTVNLFTAEAYLGYCQTIFAKIRIKK